jgi:copper chaperone
MKQYQFKTNINCGGCVDKVTPVLNADTQIKGWNVDTIDPNKMLTVETENLNEKEIQGIIAKAEFKAESLVN